jgi:bifunctional oligoribonuclease and PAP phosphatase NrnA
MIRHDTAFQQALLKARRTVVLPHARPDGDALGSTIGFAMFLESLNHSVRIISPTEVPQDFFFLDGAENIINAEKHPEEAAALIARAELICVLDCSSLNRTEQLAPFVTQNTSAITVHMDHHRDFEAFAKFQYWDIHASSTSELVYRLMRELSLSERISPASAEALYTGLLTDTGGFRHSNITSEVMHIAAELIGRGANPTRIQAALYNQNSEGRTRALGYALSDGLRVLPQFRTVIIRVPHSVITVNQLGAGGTEGFVNYGLSIKGVVLSVLLLETPDRIKMSFRSVGSFPANEVAKHFDGGGHFNAAGGRSQSSLNDTEDQLIQLLDSFKTALMSEVV